jgi:hypothetical protein
LTFATIVSTSLFNHPNYLLDTRAANKRTFLQQQQQQQQQQQPSQQSLSKPVTATIKKHGEPTDTCLTSFYTFTLLILFADTFSVIIICISYFLRFNKEPSVAAIQINVKHERKRPSLGAVPAPF